jgi:hypothetical protein
LVVVSTLFDNKMSETSDGSPDKKIVANTGNDQNPERTARRKGHRENRFEGKCAEIKDSVYDVVSGKDTFLKTTREIAEYVSRTYENAGEFRTGMVDLSLPTLHKPPRPTGATAEATPSVFDIEEWKTAMRNYDDLTRNRKKNSDRVYALVLGQCSKALRNRMEAHEKTVEGHMVDEVDATQTPRKVKMRTRRKATLMPNIF